MKLKGSTLIEAVVSALIILIVFGLTLTSLVQVESKKGGSEYYLAQYAADSLMRSIKQNHQLKAQQLTFSWGSLLIEEPSKYEKYCYKVSIKAYTRQGALLLTKTTIVDSTLSANDPQ